MTTKAKKHKGITLLINSRNILPLQAPRVSPPPWLTKQRGWARRLCFKTPLHSSHSIRPSKVASSMNSTIQGLPVDSYEPVVVLDGSRIYDYLQGVFIWFSPGLYYFSIISNANPSRQKKNPFFHCLAGKFIYGRKPTRITPTQANWSNFHIGRSFTRRTRMQDDY